MHVLGVCFSSQPTPEMSCSFLGLAPTSTRRPRNAESFVGKSGNTDRDRIGQTKSELLVYRQNGPNPKGYWSPKRNSGELWANGCVCVCVDLGVSSIWLRPLEKLNIFPAVISSNLTTNRGIKHIISANGRKPSASIYQCRPPFGFSELWGCL